MRILVIGGNGFIGAPVVKEFTEHGHEVAILRRGREGSSENVHIQGDRNQLHEYLKELRKFSPQIIVDMILSTGGQARQLMAIAGSLDARVVAISSMDVYRAWGVMLGTEPGDLEPMPLMEDSRLRTAPHTYPAEVVRTMKSIFTWVTAGYDKAAVEQEVMSGGTRNTVIRLPMVYGPGDPLHRLYGVVKRIQDGRPAIILSEEDAAWRGPRGYVENVAHAIVLTATSERARGRIYHVCDEPALTELEWQKTIAEEMNWSGKFVLLPSQRTPKHLLAPGNRSQHVVANCDRIRKELGYEETIAMNEAIRRTTAWEEMHPPVGSTFHRFDYQAEDASLD